MTNRTLPGGTPQGSRSAAAVILLAATCIAGAGSAMAGIDLSASATAGVEHNSNALELGDGEALPVGGYDNRGDISTRLSVNVGIGLSTGAGDGPFEVELHVGFLDAGFDHFDTLSRRDHDVGATLRWTPQRSFDVSLLVSQNREPLRLADVGGVEITQRTTRRTQATINLRPAQRWQIGLAPGWNETRTPIPDAEDFRYRETSGSVSLGYSGAGRLVPGVSVGALRGRNYGIEDATRYRDRSVHGTLEYQATGLSTFNLAFGQSSRRTRLVEPSSDPAALAMEGSQSAVTGELNYRRQLSVKTGIDVGIHRDFQHYDAGVNTAVGTGFNVGATWAATPKFGMSVSAGLDWESIDDVEVAADIVKRKDFSRSYSVGATYAIARRLALRGYFSRTVRTSDVDSAEFNNSIAGLELTASID